MEAKEQLREKIDKLLNDYSFNHYHEGIILPESRFEDVIDDMFEQNLLSSQRIPAEKVPEEDDIDILIFYDDTFDRGFYDKEDNKYYIFIGDEILAVNATHYQIITEPW